VAFGSVRRRFISVVLVVAGALVARASSEPAAHQDKPVNANAKAIHEFQEEVRDYVKLQHELKETLPDVPRDATPLQIYQQQRALQALIQTKRKGARPGDLFKREVRPIFRRLLYGVFTGPDGKRLRASIREENPGPAVKLIINGRYPDAIPLSTVPPQILQALPHLPDELEYRFIDDQLILLDRDAHIIVDFLTGAVPR
jgi:hypothetical protein